MVLRGMGRVMSGAAIVVSGVLMVGCAPHEQSAEQAPAPAAASRHDAGPRIPEGYQSDDCPLPAGELVSAIGSQDTYTLTYTVEDASAFDTLLAEYDALGYEQVGAGEPEMFKSATLTRDRWQVDLAYPEVAGFTLIVTARLTS